MLGKPLRFVPDDIDFHPSIGRAHVESNPPGCLGHLKRRALMLAGEETSTDQVIDERSGVAARDVDAFTRAAVIVPDDRDSMGRVLTRQPENRREPAGPDVLQPDEANPCDGMPVMKLRTEGRGQEPLHRLPGRRES